MKKADNFDAKQWLVENKITFQSRLNEEENSKFDDNAKAYGILFIDNDDEDEIEETPYIWNDEKMEALVMSMGYEDAEEIAGEFTNIFSPGDEDEMGIFRAQENNPKLQPEDLTIGMYKKNIAAEFPKEDEDNDYDLNDAFKAAPSVASYEDVLNIIKSYEDESVLSDFKSNFPEGKPVNKKDYSDFAITLIDDMSEVDFVQANWISIFDEDVFEKAGLI
jgi:hypothetical protein